MCIYSEVGVHLFWNDRSSGGLCFIVRKALGLYIDPQLLSKDDNAMLVVLVL